MLVSSFLLQFTPPARKTASPFSDSRGTEGKEGRKGRGPESKQDLRTWSVLPHSRWRHGNGKVPQRRYQRMRSAESRPGTQDGGSGAGEGEAEAAKRAAEQNV